MQAMSSRSYWKYRKCWRKIKHRTVASAEQHLRDVLARTGDKLVVYPCNVCGFFHVGHEKGA